MIYHNKMNSFNILDRKVGDGYKPLVIAELGINHNGSLEEAKKIVDAAIKSGAEIIKHQTHIIEDEMSFEAKEVIPGNSDKSIYQIMQECALNEEDEYELMNYIKAKGCIFISTPFSRAAAERLKDFDIPAYKIGSGECNNYPLVEHIAKIGKPIILSTGMNTIESIKPSVEIFRIHNVPFALMHCTNIYPTPFNLVRLGCLNEMRVAFPDAVIGLSDHTSSNSACLGAVALGASILERHFTETHDRNGPDISASMDPDELKHLIQSANEIFLASGGNKGPIPEEEKTIAFAFASVVVIKDIKKGEKLDSENIWLKRPGGGDFGVNDYYKLFGKKANKDISCGFQLLKEDID